MRKTFTNIASIMIEPVVTEKAAGMHNVNKYTFKVHPNANKADITKAVKNLFDKNVDSVNILNVTEKKKVFKGKVGSRAKYKKAVVSLKNGETFEFFNQ